MSDILFYVGLHMTTAGAVLSFLLAGLELTNPKAQRSSVLVWLAALLALAQIRFALYAAEIMHEHPLSAAFVLTNLYALGPLFGYLSYEVTGLGDIRRFRLRWHLLPLAGFLILDLGLLLLPADTARLLLQRGDDWGAANLSIGLIAAYLGILFGWLAGTHLALKRRYNLRYGRLFWVFMCLVTGIVLGAGLGFFLQVRLLFLGGTSLLTAALAVVFVYQKTQPGFFEQLRSEVRQKYETTLLGNIDIDDVKENLIRLMQVEKVYLNEDLRLTTLAEMLDLSRNQLSRILNEHLGVAYQDFVNQYRAEHAAQLLLDDPEKPTLSVGYESGFSAKSTFHKQFQRAMGMTPSAYRAKYGVG